MNKSFVEIKLALPKTFSELFGNLLVDNGCKGYVTEERGRDKVVLKGYLKGKLKAESLLDKVNKYAESLRKLDKNDIEVKVELTEIKEEDWSKKWRRTFKPIRATDRIVVKPSWIKKGFPQKLVIEMEPKMAFGTGEHSTTRLCLRVLEKYIRAGVRVLDLGTGSGILAIAAAKLGASYVLALDIDQDAINNAQENIKRNKVQKTVDLKLGTLNNKISANYFDLIVANLTKTQIAKFFDGMNRVLKKEGIFILSGIQNEENKEMKKFLLTKKVLLKEIVSEKEWVCFVGEKKSDEEF
ncbi:MAG: 50S ribosomal protein L11 methyltransferase [candidate division Zixibacteria bacterium]|nr:50S ribosomal protein L11 methyltransferase [candidate division Zixibacteria bacterium]